MTGIYDEFMTEHERRCVYDKTWSRLMDEWGEAHRRRDTAAMDALWRAIKARAVELGGDDDGG